MTLTYCRHHRAIDPRSCLLLNGLMKAGTRLTVPLIVLSIVAGAGTSRAQDTRAGVIQQQQAERLRQLAPPDESMFERTLDRLDRWGFISGPPRGVHPWVGSIYPGGGFAAGVGVRQPFGDDGVANIFGGYSISTWVTAGGSVSLPTFADKRAAVTFSGRYIDARDVKYYGTGNDTDKNNQTRFGYSPIRTGARLDVAVTKKVTVGGEVAYLDVSTAGGRTGTSIEARFDPSDTPGLGRSQFGFVNSTASAAVDTRRRLGYAGAGTLVKARFDDYRDQDHGRYSFRALDAEALQLIPILRANWVIAVRGAATLTHVADGNEIPYFLLPAIGGGASVRGYPDFRFRDRNRMVMNAELRWTPARFMDMALFYDTGKVEARRQDLDFDQLKHAYGLGMRFIGPRGYAFRMEAAHSREHRVRITIGAGGAF